jgi:hypothetical protein
MDLKDQTSESSSAGTLRAEITAYVVYTYSRLVTFSAFTWGHKRLLEITRDKLHHCSTQKEI